MHNTILQLPKALTTKVRRSACHFGVLRDRFRCHAAGVCVLVLPLRGGGLVFPRTDMALRRASVCGHLCDAVSVQRLQ